MKILSVCVSAIAIVACSLSAEAAPISFVLANCVSDGNTCGGYTASGGGSVDIDANIVGGQLELIVTNNLNDFASDDDPHIKNLGFAYNGTISDLSFASFTTLAGFVGTPTFQTDGKVTFISVDFAFDFPDSNSPPSPRFEVDEQIKILLNFTGILDLGAFSYAAAHIGGLGENGEISATLQGPPVPVPEPSTLLLMGTGFALVARRLRRRRVIVQ